MKKIIILSFLLLTTQGFSADIIFENKMVGDKKTWVPEKKDLVFKKGEVINVKLTNQLDQPHGFFIKGMTDPILVPGKIKGGKTPEISFSLKASDQPGTYEYKCHMHPAHVGGSFKVQ